MPAREPELYKDKVEVSLDGRQIFYLFFGGSVVVGIVFVLGVLVGRRVEARGHVDRARTHATTDPLAALDRLEGNGGLSFQGALTGKDAPSSVEKTIDGIEKARAAKPAVADKPVVVADKPKVEEAKSGPVVKPDAEVKKPEPKIEKKAEPKSEPKPEKKSEEAAKPAAKIEKPADAKPADSEAKAVVKPEAENKTRYTLQLSSFQDRAEAEAFLSSVKAQGFTAQITQAEVEGKGTFYRVRTGTYRSMDAATAAKGELEKSGKSASIMKL
jgi:cell division septation protein DedD